MGKVFKKNIEKKGKTAPLLTPSSMIFLNGNVLTMDSKNTIAEAVSISDGRIIAVGSNKAIKEFIVPDSVVTDLQGKTLMPGFIEAHGHFPLSGMNAVGVNVNSPPIGSFKTIPQILEALKLKAANTEKGKWVIGFGYDNSGVEENRLMTRYDLDNVSLDHPIYVAHVSGHLGSVNTPALEAFDIKKNTPDPEGGIICKDSRTGQPVGILEETANILVRDEVLKLSPQDTLSVMNWAVNDYAGNGVTTVQCGNEKEALFVKMSNASQNGLIPLRVMVWPNFGWIDKILDGKIDVSQHISDRFQIGAVKIVGDGSIQGNTAFLTRPYHTPHNNNKNYHGYPVLKRSTMAELITKFHRAGLQVAVHGNGDAAIDNIIDAIAKAQNAFPREDHRHIIVHCQTVRNDQLDQMKMLGITPSFFPAHIYYWGERHRDIYLGPERTNRLNPLKTAGKKGLRYTIHLDTPVVPMNPLLLAWTAVNRLSHEGNILGQNERISTMEALRAVTIDAAWQIFQENNRGSIEIGKLADMIILSGNPLSDPENLKDLQVLKTFVGGTKVFETNKWDF